MKSLAEPFNLVLSRIAGGVEDALSRSDPSPRERSLGEEKNPSRGENPREARQAWRAWSLAKIIQRILWALAGRPVVPWFPLCRQ